MIVCASFSVSVPAHTSWCRAFSTLSFDFAPTTSAGNGPLGVGRGRTLGRGDRDCGGSTEHEETDSGASHGWLLVGGESLLWPRPYRKSKANRESPVTITACTSIVFSSAPCDGAGALVLS